MTRRSRGGTARRLVAAATVSSAVLVVVGAGAAVARAAPRSRPDAAAAGSGGRAATVSSAQTDAFETEPVVLQGADFPGWTSGPEVTARPPQAPTDYGVFDSQGSLLSPLGLQSDCYQAHPQPDVNGRLDASHGDHSCFQGSDAPVRTALRGVPAQSLLGYRWDAGAGRFVQIPFQVDTMWEHYLSNNASGFAFYSGADQMLTYTFDEEPFLRTSNRPFSTTDPTGVCRDRPPTGQGDTTPDPNPALIDTDQLSFMAHDAGPQAPASAALPSGIVSAYQVRVADPASGATRYAYVMESSMTTYDVGGRSVVAPTVLPAYTAANSPYVRYEAFDPFTDRYERFDGADQHGVESAPVPDMFAYSQSNYSDYGNAPVGPVCDLARQPGSLSGPAAVVPVVGRGFSRSGGALALDKSTYVQRRPLDIARIRTQRYSFGYGDPAPTTTLDGQTLASPQAGRWIMDGLSVSPDDRGLATGDYGRSLVDRFKGRAFQQSPGGQTPCCGYEDEQVNWNGSSITMGIKVGPVRDIRVTWGSDSGTNVTRTDIFYADSIDHEYNLRVHPIPPLDGIYTQWNMDAGAVTRYYNPENPNGVPVTGINPVRYGDTTDFVGPGGVSESSNDTLGRQERSLDGGKPLSVGDPSPSTCGSFPANIPVLGAPSDCVYGSFDVGDATFSGPSPLLGWEELTGPAGTSVDQWAVDTAANPSPGGAQSAVEAQPYYVDDTCFDDGTGNSPGPQVKPRQADTTTWGFTDAGGRPVAVSPAPPPAARYLGTVRDGDSTYVTDAGAAQAAAHPQTMSTDDTFPRRCWDHSLDGTPYNIPGTATYDASRPAQSPDRPPDPRFGPQGDVRYYEGDVATHGLHMVFTGDADNADQTTPVDEEDAVDHQAVLPPDQPDVGAAYGARFTTPVVIVVTPFGPSPAAAMPQPDVRGPGLPSSAASGPAGTGSSNPGAGSGPLPTTPPGPAGPAGGTPAPLAPLVTVSPPRRGATLPTGRP